MSLLGHGRHGDGWALVQKAPCAIRPPAGKVKLCQQFIHASKGPPSLHSPRSSTTCLSALKIENVSPSGFCEAELDRWYWRREDGRWSGDQTRDRGNSSSWRSSRAWERWIGQSWQRVSPSWDSHADRQRGTRRPARRAGHPRLAAVQARAREGLPLVLGEPPQLAVRAAVAARVTPSRVGRSGVVAAMAPVAPVAPPVASTILILKSSMARIVTSVSPRRSTPASCRICLGLLAAHACPKSRSGAAAGLS